MEYQKAKKILLNGDLVAVPTDTVYGIAAVISSEEAVNKLFAIKGRPLSNPFTVNLSCAGELDKYLEKKTPLIEKVTKEFWPGALTIVVRVKKELVHPLVRAGLDECGFRVAGNKSLRELIHEVGPVALPSANLSGKRPLLTKEEVESEFPGLFVVSSTESSTMIPSTVIRITDGIEILREGSISKTMLDQLMVSDKL